MKELLKIFFLFLIGIILISWTSASDNLDKKNDHGFWVVPGDSGMSPQELRAITSMGGQTIVGTSDGTVYRKSKGSETWQKMGQAPVSQANDYEFMGPDSGYVVGNGSTIHFTTNGGESWTPQTTEYHFDDFNAVGFSDSQNGFVVGTTGIIYKTSNGGSTWQYKEGLHTNPDYNDVYTDSGNVQIVGSNGTMIRSTNGGDSWTTVDSKTGMCLFDISMPNRRNGTAVGNYGTIITTSDSGVTWNAVNSGTTRKLNTVAIDPENYKNQYVGGDSGYIARSSDGGFSWAEEEVPTKQKINKLFYADSTDIWAACDSGVILRRTNPPAAPANVKIDEVYSDSADINWEQNSSLSLVHLSGKSENDHDFSEMATIPGNYSQFTVTGLEEGTRYWFFLQGEREGVKSGKSNTVSCRTKLITPALISVENSDSTTIALFWHNNSLKSTEVHIDKYDSGYYNSNMYKREFKTLSDTGFTLQAIVDAEDTSYIDSDIEPGKTYHYRIKVINDSTESFYSNVVSVRTTVTDIENHSSIPMEYSLSQNYPNPFNPSTKIKYSIPFTTDAGNTTQRNTTLKIYDVLGNEIATIVNENQPPGNYEYIWNTNNISSGVYFYVLRSGTFKQTKKMVLLR
jgi:photosystem II stability/assembly factor-like uncharacterized protein